MNSEEKLRLREKHLSSALSLSYREPLDIVRGEGAYLIDTGGRRYLDLVNNVCHVGHCHPHVVRAAAEQMATLNTNTRYLHENILRYAERLTATFPAPLEVAFFVCSGSEANDLALRLARAATGGRTVCVLDGAYHGALSTLVDISPYKYDGPGGDGRPEHVVQAPMPDTYRGEFRGTDAGERYAARLGEQLDAAVARGQRLGAFFAESMMGCGGQVELPPGFLAAAYERARAAGGICVADEVQVGFGRVGSHMWAFERHGVVPDIVTLGKPIGNGHPLAAVITTRAIADAFSDGMEYFNTFGGNPVSCAVGMAVLDVIEDEGLREHANEVGSALLADLARLRSKHALIGDVRGAGLFVGVELVSDRDDRTPAPDEASAIVELVKQRGVLLSTDGPLHNVLKIKPPLVVTREELSRFARVLDEALTTLGDRRGPSAALRR